MLFREATDNNHNVIFVEHAAGRILDEEELSIAMGEERLIVRTHKHGRILRYPPVVKIIDNDGFYLESRMGDMSDQIDIKQFQPVLIPDIDSPLGQAIQSVVALSNYRAAEEGGTSR